MLCRFIVLFTFFSISINTFAQSTRVSGVVADRLRFPLPGAVVSSIAEADSTPINGTTSDTSGKFMLEAKAGHYLISVSMLGFQTKHIKLTLQGEVSVQLDTIILEEATRQLDEAIVKLSRPAVQFEAGKTIVVPDFLVVAGQGDIFAVLKNTPGLFATEEGGISINGQSGVNVRVNGKDTYLSGTALVNFLRSLPAGSVEKIEVMSSPSSAYDAAGKAGVIDIKLKKNLSEGFMVSGRGNFQQSRHNRSDWGLRASMGKRRFGLGFDYSGAESGRLKYGNLSRTINFDAVSRTAHQNISLVNNDLMQNIRVFTNFEISKRLTVDAYASKSFYQRKIPGSSSTTFGKTLSFPDSLLHASSFSRYRQNTHTAGIQATYKSEKQRELTISADHLTFGHKEYLNMANLKSFPGKSSISDTLNGNFGDRIHAFSTQADWSSPLTSYAKFQAGFKWAQVNINNHAIYADVINGEIQSPSALSVQYRYSEGTSAIYAQISGSYKKWNYQAGTRIENTQINGNIFYLAHMQDSSYRLKYTRLFPSLHVQYALSGERQLAMSYTQRITRPNYRDLSPSGYIVDRYVMASGNPALRPELTRNVEATLILGRSWRSSLYYITNKQTIVQVFLPTQNGGLMITPANLASRKSFGVKLDGSDILSLKWWQLSGSISISGITNQWIEQNLSLTSFRIVPIFNLSNAISLGKGWAGELSGYYNGRMPLGQLEVPAVWSVSAGIRKKFTDGRLTMRLYGTDLLASIRERSVFRSKYLYGRASLRYEETCVGLSLSYTFTKGHQKELKEKGNEEKKRINF